MVRKEELSSAVATRIRSITDDMNLPICYKKYCFRDQEEVIDRLAVIVIKINSLFNLTNQMNYTRSPL